MKIRLVFLALGLIALLGSLLASSQRISAYQATDRLSSSPAVGPSVLGTGKTLLSGISVAPRTMVTSTVYLPLIIRPEPPTTPGYWAGVAFSQGFYVTPDSAYVRNQFLYFDVPACMMYNIKVTHTVSEPIVSKHYSFTGSFYASGTFYSPTMATVTDGLSKLYISGCGYVTGGPWTDNFYWVSNAQPALGARVKGSQTPLTARLVSQEFDSSIPTDHTVEITGVH